MGREDWRSDAHLIGLRLLVFAGKVVAAPSGSAPRKFHDKQEIMGKRVGEVNWVTTHHAVVLSRARGLRISESGQKSPVTCVLYRHPTVASLGNLIIC